MSELTKTKLMLVGAIMLAFTIVNIINKNEWWAYLLSLIVFPLFTFFTIEIVLKLKSKK